METLYAFGRDGYLDLAPRIREATDAGMAVIWMSASGTRQVLSRVHGDPLTRIRISAGNEHAGDGLPVVVEEPWSATTCGFSCASGYRSTPPLVVAVVVSEADVEELNRLVLDLTRDPMPQEEWSAVPSDHPVGPCPAYYCRVRTVVSGT